MAKAVTIEQLQKDLDAGKISKDVFNSIKKYILSRPTRVNGQTDINVRKYAEAAGLTAEKMERVEALIETMNAGIEELRGLIGHVVVERKNTRGKMEKGFPLPRWFCNVTPLAAQKVEAGR
jgi:hypothetical protein